VKKNNPVTITIDLPTDLLHQAEATAAERGLHLNDLVEHGLRLAIEHPPAADQPASGGAHLRYHDLDHLAGTWSEEEFAEFEEHLSAQRSIDEDLWR
jgi:hypothetical protein